MALLFLHTLSLTGVFLSICRAASDISLAFGKTNVLTKGNFSQGVSKHPFTFVEFYAPWCGACKQLEPEWEKAAKLIGTFDVPVAKVDVSIESGEDLAGEHGVTSTPTLMLFRGDPTIKAKYTGFRDANSMADWLGAWVEGESVARPEFTEKEYSWESDAALKVLGVLGEDAGANTLLEELIEAVAFMLNPEAPGSEVPVGIAQVPAEAMAKMGISCEKLPCVAAIRQFPFENRTVSTFEKIKQGVKLQHRVKTFMAWIELKRLPALLPASDETEKYILKENAKPGNAVAVYFGSDDNATHDIYSLAVEMLPRFKNLKWVRAEKNEFGENLGQMIGLEAADFPEFAVWEFGKEEDDDRVFKLSKQEGSQGFPLQNVGEAVRSFIDDWEKGALRSEPDPVISVTSESFEQVVYDKSQDVLVEFYAPWCGHCKALAPEYKQVAAHYSKDAGVAIAKMDATSHSHKSAKIKSFPTLMMYTAKDKPKPITLQFEAERDRDSIIKLVEKHRTTPSVSSGDGVSTCAAGDSSCEAASPAANGKVVDEDDAPFPEF